MPSDAETFMNEFYDTPLTKREAMVERWFARLRNEAIEECAKLVDDFDCHLAGYPNEEAQSFFEAGVADTCNIAAEHIRALSHLPQGRSHD